MEIIFCVERIDPIVNCIRDLQHLWQCNDRGLDICANFVKELVAIGKCIHGNVGCLSYQEWMKVSQSLIIALSAYGTGFIFRFKFTEFLKEASDEV